MRFLLMTALPFACTGPTPGETLDTTGTEDSSATDTAQPLRTPVTFDITG